MVGKHFPEVQVLLPIRYTYGWHHMKAKLPVMSLSILEGYPLAGKRCLEVPFYRIAGIFLLVQIFVYQTKKPLK